MNKGFLVIFLFLFTLKNYSQNLTGIISSNNKSVSFSTINIKEPALVTTSDIDGKFSFKLKKPGTYKLSVSSLGYKKENITVEVNDNNKSINIELKPLSYELNQVVITGTMKESFISASPVKVDVLTMKFMEKIATSNVMETIENVNGVQKQVNCGVCGTNDIHLNGMEGPYTLVLIDGMPIMSSLSTVYGLNGISTSLIKQIEIVKGPSSTLYGTEALAGVINIITKDANDVSLLEFDIFGTSHLEKNIDFSFAPKSERLNVLFSGNAYFMKNFLDDNKDLFSDIPLSERYSLFNRWAFNRKNQKELSFSAKLYNEKRLGGVKEYSHKIRGSDSVYGESIYTDRLELLAKYDIPFIENLNLSMSYNFHHQDSYYGNTKYDAFQEIYFSNLVWNKKINLNHDLLMGYSHRYQKYSDSTPISIDEKRFIPAIFIQDEMLINKNWKMLAGIRADHHKKHGNIISPRINLKYNPTVYTTLRLNSGTGFRIVNLFTEDHAFLTGTREVRIIEELKPEKSININANFNHIFSFYKSTGSIDLDLFYTDFSNKIVPDYDQDPNLIVYQNLNGNSVSRGVSINLRQSFEFPLNYNLGITLLDVFAIDENNTKTKELFAPDFSAVFSTTYQFPKKISLDWSAKLTGPMKLPTFPNQFKRPEQSPTFSVHNVQLKKVIHEKFKVYFSIKNIFNRTQSSPIIDWENPFSDNFDTSYAYGPLQSRRLLAGISLKF